MCFVYLPRNFNAFSLRNIGFVMMRSKTAKILQFSFSNSSKQSNDSEHLSNNDFDSSGSLKSDYKIDLQAITQGNAKKIKELDLLLMKMELKMQQGTQLPKFINTNHWRTLLTLLDDEIWTFFQYRLAIETLVESGEKERKKFISYFDKDACNGLFDSEILDRIPYLYDFNSFQAMLYGPRIVIDCGLEKTVPRKWIWDTAFRMFQAWTKNRIFCNPSHIIYCNLNPNGEFFSLFMEMLEELNHDPTSFTWTSKSYLELFPKENLIYLSPDSKYTMEKYNGKKIYIIGGLSNRTFPPITYKKAKLEEVQTAKLPIDKYVDWGSGPKKLTVDNCVSLLNDLKEGCNWNVAFRHLPKQSWARHGMDENRIQHFKNYKKPTKIIQEQYRQHFLKQF